MSFECSECSVWQLQLSPSNPNAFQYASASHKKKRKKGYFEIQIFQYASASHKKKEKKGYFEIQKKREKRLFRNTNTALVSLLLTCLPPLTLAFRNRRHPQSPQHMGKI